jgi:hypothetical protein
MKNHSQAANFQVHCFRLRELTITATAAAAAAATLLSLSTSDVRLCVELSHELLHLILIEAILGMHYYL